MQAAEPAQRKTTQSESYIPVEPIYTTILDGVRPRGLLLVGPVLGHASWHAYRAALDA